MNREYCEFYSQHMGRNMEYLVYGTSGRTMLVFPSASGRYFDYESFDMIHVLAPFIESGKLKVVCCDGIDDESWAAKDRDGRSRIEAHERWYNYINEELVPKIKSTPEERLIVTGCSMGGYHCGNFFFRRPDLYGAVVALSGIYKADYFFNDYKDDLVYLNSPIDYLPNMPADHYYWDMYRNSTMIFCVGQGAWEDELLESTRQLEGIIKSKGINNAWFDYWGLDVAHDWPWWRVQIVYFLEKILNQ